MKTKIDVVEPDPSGPFFSDESSTSLTPPSPHSSMKESVVSSGEEQKEKEEEKEEKQEEEQEKELSQGVLNCLAIIDGVGDANPSSCSRPRKPSDDVISDEEDREAFAESRVINSRPLPQKKRKKTGPKTYRDLSKQNPGTHALRLY